LQAVALAGSLGPCRVGQREVGATHGQRFVSTDEIFLAQHWRAGRGRNPRQLDQSVEGIHPAPFGCSGAVIDSRGSEVVDRAYLDALDTGAGRGTVPATADAPYLARPAPFLPSPSLVYRKSRVQYSPARQIRQTYPRCLARGHLHARGRRGMGDCPRWPARCARASSYAFRCKIWVTSASVPRSRDTRSRVAAFKVSARPRNSDGHSASLGVTAAFMPERGRTPTSGKPLSKSRGKFSSGASCTRPRAAAARACRVAGHPSSLHHFSQEQQILVRP